MTDNNSCIMDKEYIRTRLTWLINNGFDKEVSQFVNQLQLVSIHLIKQSYPTNKENGLRKANLQRRCRTMQKLDTLNYTLDGRHIFRTFNVLEETDMLNLYHELCEIVF